MASKKHLDDFYMSTAKNVAKLSHGVRAKVGAVLVTKNDVMISSCNGLPKALGNILEYEDMQLISLFGKSPYWEKTGNLITKPEVIHAELNCILKAAKEGVSVKGSTIYITLSPCALCSSMIASSGIKRVVYFEEYRDRSGLDILEKCGIEVEKISD